MADLLKIHLFQAIQWKEAEKTILQLDQKLSSLGKATCPPESVCAPIMRFLTESLSIQILFGILLALLVYKTSEHLKQKMQFKLIGLLGIFFAIGDLLSNQLKYIFQRMRPDHAEYFFDLGGTGSFQPSLGFPSNHAFNLFALSTLLILLRRKGYLRGVNFPIALWALSFFVGISRVLLWRHYPLDVVAGLFFGTLYAVAALPLMSKVVHAPKLTDKL